MLVFGAINVDFVFPVARLPKSGDTIWSDEGRMSVGGKGANQAIAASRDGAQVSMAGAVGRDTLADVVLGELATEGVQLASVIRCEVLTGRSAICVEPAGHTSIVTERGANAMAQSAQISDDTLERTRTLLVQMDTAAAEVAKLVLRARRLGVRVILNLSPSRLIDADALRAADMVIGNNNEIAWLGRRLATGSNAASIHAALGVTVIRMMGVQGVEAVSEDGWLYMPAMPIEMLDTTVAGDCFVGVFAAALHRRSQLSEALRRASAAAALSTTRLGAKATMPHRSEIDAAVVRAAQPTSRQSEVPE